MVMAQTLAFFGNIQFAVSVSEVSLFEECKSYTKMNQLTYIFFQNLKFNVKYVVSKSQTG